MNENIESTDDAEIDRDGGAGAEDSRILRIEDRRDDIVRRLETAWQAALDDLFAEPRAA